jgi:hypothetical protein
LPPKTLVTAFPLAASGYPLDCWKTPLPTGPRGVPRCTRNPTAFAVEMVGEQGLSNDIDCRYPISILLFELGEFQGNIVTVVPALDGHAKLQAVVANTDRKGSLVLLARKMGNLTDGIHDFCTHAGPW